MLKWIDWWVKDLCEGLDHPACAVQIGILNIIILILVFFK
jgi:hypothetical protein